MAIGNGDEQVRDEVMATVRRRVRELAKSGFSPRDLQAFIANVELNESERALAWLLIGREVAEARRERITQLRPIEPAPSSERAHRLTGA
jgi:hypothetical protein